MIANKKALYASKENILQVEKIKSDLSKKDNEKKINAKKIADKINKKSYSVSKLCTENKELYGSVKPTEISKLIFEIDKVEIKPSMIQPIKEIKSIGKFKSLRESRQPSSRIMIEGSRYLEFFKKNAKKQPQHDDHMVPT